MIGGLGIIWGPQTKAMTIPGIQAVKKTANWVIIYYLPPFTRTWKIHWMMVKIGRTIFFCHAQMYWVFFVCNTRAVPSYALRRWSWQGFKINPRSPKTFFPSLYIGSKKQWHLFQIRANIETNYWNHHLILYIITPLSLRVGKQSLSHFGVWNTAVLEQSLDFQSDFNNKEQDQLLPNSMNRFPHSFWHLPTHYTSMSLALAVDLAIQRKRL